MLAERYLVVDQACAQGAFRRAQAIQQLHASVERWHIQRALPALGNVRLDIADLGAVPGMLTTVGDRSIATISEYLLGTPLEGAALAYLAAQVVIARTHQPRTCECPHRDKAWTIAARLAVPDSMVSAERSGLISAATIEQQAGVPLALVRLRLAITPHSAMAWGTQRYLDVRTAALAEWHTWLSGAGDWARRRIYSNISDPCQHQSA